MTNAKHTPGPWNIYNKDEVRAGSASRSERIAYCIAEHGVVRDSTEDFANARLIAAAPELLEALKDILENCYFEKKSHGCKRNINEFRDTANAAIAKATGQAA